MPRVNRTRYRGVFAPHHRLREQVAAAKRGRHGASPAKKSMPAHDLSMSLKCNA